jgi:hypothetical protein
LQVLDETRFKQQRTDLAGGAVKRDAMRVLQQARLLRCAQVRQNAGADVDALSDVERPLALVFENVNTRLRRQGRKAVHVNVPGIAVRAGRVRFEQADRGDEGRHEPMDDDSWARQALIPEAPKKSVVELTWAAADQTRFLNQAQCLSRQHGAKQHLSP